MFLSHKVTNFVAIVFKTFGRKYLVQEIVFMLMHSLLSSHCQQRYLEFNHGPSLLVIVY